MCWNVSLPFLGIQDRSRLNRIVRRTIWYICLETKKKSLQIFSRLQWNQLKSEFYRIPAHRHFSLCFTCGRYALEFRWLDYKEASICNREWFVWTRIEFAILNGKVTSERTTSKFKWAPKIMSDTDLNIERNRLNIMKDFEKIKRYCFNIGGEFVSVNMALNFLQFCESFEG